MPVPGWLSTASSSTGGVAGSSTASCPEPGAPADAVIYAQDPRLDLSRLSHPIAVVLRGHRVR